MSDADLIRELLSDIEAQAEDRDPITMPASVAMPIAAFIRAEMERREAQMSADDAEGTDRYLADRRTYYTVIARTEAWRDMVAAVRVILDGTS